MPKKLLPVKIQGMNITSHPKEVSDNESYDMKNVLITQLGELKRRPGLRMAGASAIENFDTNGEQILHQSSIIKHKQIYTTSKEYIDVYAIGNKVYLYDEKANKFVLIYQATGEDRVDIDTYLGHILVSSHGSNLAILRRYQHNAFLLAEGSHILKSEGVIDESNKTIDYKEEDRFEDAELVDMDLDETSLYSISLATGEAKVLDVSGIGHSGTCVKDVVLDNDHNYTGKITVQVGYDHEDNIILREDEDDDVYENSFPFFTQDRLGNTVKKINVDETLGYPNIEDFSVGTSYYDGGKSGRRDIKIETQTKQKIKAKRTKDKLYGVEKGFVYDEENELLTPGKIKVKSLLTLSATGDDGISSFNDLPGLVHDLTNFQTTLLKDLIGTYTIPAVADKTLEIFPFLWKGKPELTNTWNGKKLYIGHGLLTSIYFNDVAISNWSTTRKAGAYGIGLVLYWYTGNKASTYLKESKYHTESQERAGYDLNLDQVEFTNEEMNNFHEICGICLVSSSDPVVAEEHTPWLFQGTVIKPSSYLTSREEINIDNSSIAGYSQKITITETSPFKTVSGSTYVPVCTINGEKRTVFIDKASGRWEEFEIGQVSADGNSIEYIDSDYNWIRKVYGYGIEEFKGETEADVKLSIENKMTWTVHGTVYSSDIVNSYAKSQLQIESGDYEFSNRDFKLDMSLTDQGSTITTKMSMPDSYLAKTGFTNAIDFASSIGNDALEYEIFKAMEFDADDKPEIRVDGFVDRSIINTISFLECSPFNVWYRVKSIFNQNTVKIYLNQQGTGRSYNGIPDENYYTVFPDPGGNRQPIIDMALKNENQLNILVCHFNFAFEFLNAKSFITTDEEELDVVAQETEDYEIQFPSDRQDAIKLRYHNKDNLAISRIIDTYYSDTIEEVRFAKANNFWFLTKDLTSGSDRLLIILKNDFQGIDAVCGKWIDAATFGNTIKSFESFTHANGRMYVALHTELGIFILWFRTDNNGQSIEIVEEFLSTTTKDRSITVSDIKEIQFKQYSDRTDMYMLFDDIDEPLAKVHILTDYTNPNGYDVISLGKNSSGQVIVYNDILNNDLEYFFHQGTPPFELLSFTFNDDGIPKLIIADNGDDISLVNSYKWVVNSSVNNLYDKILTDTNYGHIKQILPETTPPKPRLTVRNDPAGTLDGIFQYMFIVREYDADGEIIYESYPSEYSSVVNCQSPNNIVDIEQFGTTYTQYSDSVSSVKLLVYRATITDYTKYIRLTDFYSIVFGGITEVPMKLLGGSSTEWIIDEAPKIDNNSDTKNLDKYRGYSNFYPRAKYVEVYNNVVYTANDFRYRNNIYFSDLYDPTVWRPSRELEAGLFTNDEITGLKTNDGLYVFTRDEIHLINGVSTQVSMNLMTNEVGCIDDNTIQLVNKLIFFVSEKGVYAVRGYDYTPIDQKVSKITHEFTTNSRLISFYDNYNQEYRLIYDNNKILIYNAVLRSWYRFEYPYYSRLLIGFSRENTQTDLTENGFIIINKESDLNGNLVDTFRMMVEDKHIPFDQINGYETKPINSYVYTKYFEFGNPFTEYLFRRLYLDTINSHGIEVSISINEGEYTRIIEQRKREYFNTVPNIWLRFNELYGDKTINYGTSGGYWLNRFCEFNKDGKIDRVYRSNDLVGSEVLGYNFPVLDNVSIMGWFKPEKEERMVLLSNSYYYWLAGVSFTAYTESDFDPWLSDYVDATTEFVGDKLIADSAGDIRIKIDTCVWINGDAVGAGKTFIGTNTGVNTRGGSVSFECGTGETWSDFSLLANGLYTITLPQIGIGEMIVEGNNQVL